MANFVGDISTYSYAWKQAFPSPTAGLNTDANGSAVDTNDAVSNVITGYLDVGFVSGTSPTLNVKFQESADGSTGWTDITGAAFTQVTAANNLQAIVFAPQKRYIRAVVDVGGTDPVFRGSVGVLYPRRVVPSTYGGFVNTVPVA